MVSFERSGKIAAPTIHSPDCGSHRGGSRWRRLRFIEGNNAWCGREVEWYVVQRRITRHRTIVAASLMMDYLLPLLSRG
jgi:hypothetical protein